MSAILLPGIVLSTLKQWFEKNNNLFYSALSFWIIAFIPFLSLQLTTPHNLVLLFTLLLVFTNFSFLKKHISFFIPLLISTAALMTHPLIGAPGLVFTLSLFSLKKLNHQKKYILPLLGFTFLVLCFLLPVMFTLNAVRIEKPLPTLGNPFTHIASFFELFKYPYWYAKTSPLRFEILYFCERLIVPTTLILSAFGFWKHQKHTSSKIFFIFPLTSLALFIDAWLLRSWIVFPDVVTYEQGDYPLRLIHTSIIFLLPFAMYGWSKLYDIKYSEKLKNFLIFFLLPIVLGITLYFSYPQKNVKVRFPGYNVTATDFKVVKWIHSQNTTYDYIVLSNQLVSAAALTEYSFAQYFKTPSGELFYYSIPTGGLMYKYYGKMIYEGQKPEYMTEAMDTVGVKKAYFVVNSYWANSKAIIEEAKKTAHQSQAFDGGTIWVFEYIHP